MNKSSLQKSLLSPKTRQARLLLFAGTDVFDAILLTAQRLESSRVVSGLSTKLAVDEQAQNSPVTLGKGFLTQARLTMEIIGADGRRHDILWSPRTPPPVPAM